MAIAWHTKLEFWGHISNLISEVFWRGVSRFFVRVVKFLVRVSKNLGIACYLVLIWAWLNPNWFSRRHYCRTKLILIFRSPHNVPKNQLGLKFVNLLFLFSNSFILRSLHMIYYFVLKSEVFNHNSWEFHPFHWSVALKLHTYVKVKNCIKPVLYSFILNILHLIFDILMTSIQ